MKLTTPLLIMLSLPGPAIGGEVEIVDAKAQSTAPGVYRLDVTLRHADTGWEHYADGWQVLAQNGDILGERILHHPHVEEQPFTRSLSGVQVPSSAEYVLIRAHDKVHGHGVQLFRVELH